MAVSTIPTNGLRPVGQNMTASGSYSSVISNNYGAVVYKTGNMCIARVAVGLKARTGASKWIEVFTLPYPSKYNISANAITTNGQAEQIRIDGQKMYVNILNTVTAEDLLSVALPYITE